jgi:adenine deaminase
MALFAMGFLAWSGRMGVGFVRGIGLKRGAMAFTVAHDHHNLMVLGADDVSMMTAAQAVVFAGGGLAVAEGNTVLALLPLPIAGLMSDKPIEAMLDQTATLANAVKKQAQPWMTPSWPWVSLFLAWNLPTSAWLM